MALKAKLSNQQISNIYRLSAAAPLEINHPALYFKLQSGLFVQELTHNQTGGCGI
jgi:hypothetical protein